jgi:hypothetical protein
VFAHPLVDDTKRNGIVSLGGRTFRLRRVAFPKEGCRQGLVVDLLESAAAAGLDRHGVVARLCLTLRAGVFGANRLSRMAEGLASAEVAALVASTVRDAALWP